VGLTLSDKERLVNWNPLKSKPFYCAWRKSRRHVAARTPSGRSTRFRRRQRATERPVQGNISRGLSAYFLIYAAADSTVSQNVVSAAVANLSETARI